MSDPYHQCRVEVETNPSMIRTFLVVDTGGMTEKQATGNISKSLASVYVGYSMQYIYAGTANSDHPIREPVGFLTK